MAETPTSNTESDNNNLCKPTQGKTPLENMSKDDLLKQVKKQLALLQKLKTKCDDSDKKYSNLKEEFKKKCEESDSCFQKLQYMEQVKETNANLEEDVKKLNEANEKYAKMQREMTDELECRRMKEETLSVAIKQMQTEVGKLSTENNMLNSQNNLLTEELQEKQKLSQDYIELKEKVETFNQERMTHSRECDEYKMVLNRFSEENEFLLTQSAQEKMELQNKIEQLEKDKESLYEKNLKCKQHCENLRIEIEEKKNSNDLIEEIKKENETLQKKLDQALIDYTILKEKNENQLKMDEMNSQMKNFFVNKETQFSDGEEDDDLQSELLQELYNRIRVLELELQNAVEERDQLLFQEEREQKDCMMLQDRVHVLETEIDDMKGKLESSEFELEELRARLEESELQNTQKDNRYIPLASIMQNQECQTDYFKLEDKACSTDSSGDDLILSTYVLDSNYTTENSHQENEFSVADKMETVCEQIPKDNEEFNLAKLALKGIINEINILISSEPLNAIEDLEPQHVWLKNICNVLVHFKKKIEDFHLQITSKENELINIGGSFEIQRKQLGEIRETVASLESKLQSYKEKNDEIIQEKQSLEEHFNQLKQMDLKHEEQLFEQSFEIKNLKDKLEERNQQLNSLYEEIEQNKQNSYHDNQLFTEMKTEKESLEENFYALKQDLEKVRNESCSPSQLDSLQKVNDELKSSIFTSQNLISKKDEEIHHLHKCLARLETDKQDLSSTHNLQLEIIQNILWKIFLVVKEIKKSFDLLKKDNHDLDNANNCSQEYSYEIFSQLENEKKTEEIFTIIDIIKQNFITFKNLYQHHENLNEKSQKEKEQQTELLQDLEHLANQNIEQKKEIEMLKDVENMIKKEIEEWKIKYDESCSEKHDLLEKLLKKDYLEQEFKMLKLKYEELTVEFASMEEEKALCEKKLEKITLNLATDRAELANLQALNDQLKSEILCLCEDRKALELCKAELDTKLTNWLNDLNEKEKATKELKLKLESSTTRQLDLEQELQKEKEQHSATLKKLDTLQKEAKQQSLLNLEFADYERLVADLNQQIENKNETIRKIMEDVQQQNDIVSSLRTQLEQTELQFDQSENRGNKLKVLLVKTKKELSEAKRQGIDFHVTETKLQAEIESRQQTIESMKVENAELLSQFQKLQENMRVTKDAHQRTVRILESQIESLKIQVSNIEEEYKKCHSDYENYKIRVHSVLKQQKDKISQKILVEEEQEEKACLQKTIEQLKLKLQETNEQLQTLMMEANTSQEEYDRLLQTHNNLLQDAQKKEMSWKEELEHLVEKYTTSRQEHLETVRALQQQNEALRLNFKDQLQNLKEDHRKALEREHLRLVAVEAELTRLQEQQKISPTRELEIFDVSNTERQEGEGSENTETVFGSKQNIDSSSSLVSFEQLLNSDTKSISSQISISQPEVEALEDQLAATIKKLQHITEVLNESEASNIRLTEQVQVLKDEIRRIERNQERKEHASNLEYLKNIVLKFITLEGDDERVHLIPVLTMMLQLSPEERNKLITVTNGDVSKKKPVGDSSTWGNYLPRWSGLV